jgi:monoamine oxidase
LKGDPEFLLELVGILRDESTGVDLDNPLKSHNAAEIDQLDFKEFCVQRTKNDQAIRIADLISTALLGVESDEVSALYMLHYFKSGFGIDNLPSDGKDGGQYLRNRQGMALLSVPYDFQSSHFDSVQPC